MADKSYIGIFIGPENISLARINEEDNRMLIKHFGQLFGRDVGPRNILEVYDEKKLLDHTGVTSEVIRVYPFDIEGNVCSKNMNPRIVAEFESLKIERMKDKLMINKLSKKLINIQGNELARETQISDALHTSKLRNLLAPPKKEEE